VGWLSNLLSTPRELPDPSAGLASPSTAFPDIEGRPVAINPAMRDLRSVRELIHDSAIRTAQAYGIPEKWLGFEVVTISNESSAYFQLQVILRHWDDRLWAHTYAFELAVRKRIHEVDSTIASALRAVLWRVEHDAGCPFDDLPVSEWGRKPVLIGDIVPGNPMAFSATQPASAATLAAGRVLDRQSANESGGLDSGTQGSMNVGGFAATQPFSASTRGELEGPSTMPLLDEDIDWTKVGTVTQPKGSSAHKDFENTHPVPGVVGSKMS
jgi:hypothetical protein